MFGVDLSSNQVVTSYDKLNSGIDFAYIRVFRSSGEQDVSWRAFHDGITKLRAPYIFLRPTSQESLQSQFSKFWGWCGGVEWEWGPVIDSEYGGITGAEIAAAVEQCRAVTGRQVVYAYTGRSNLIGPCKPSTFVVDDGVRIIGARYFANDQSKAFTNLGLDSPTLDAVQYWDKGTVPGISGLVDLNSARQIIGEGMTSPAPWIGLWPSSTDEAKFAVATGLGVLSSDGHTVTVTVPVTQQGAWLANTCVRVAMLADQQLTGVVKALTSVDADVKAGSGQVLTAIQDEGTPEVTEEELQNALMNLNIGEQTAQALAALFTKAAQL